MGSLSLASVLGLNETAGESVAASTNPSENLPRPLINRLGLDSGLPLLDRHPVYREGAKASRMTAIRSAVSAKQCIGR